MAKGSGRSKLLLLAFFAVLLVGLVLWTFFLMSLFWGSKSVPSFTRSSLSIAPSSSPSLPENLSNVSQPSNLSNSSIPKENFTNPQNATTVYAPHFMTSGTLVHPSQPANMSTKPIWDAPVGTNMPDLRAFQLTNEMVKHRAKDNVIIVTFGNYAFMDFIVNWVSHLTDLNVFNFLIGAMDIKTLEALYWKGLPVFDMGSDVATNDVGWGSPMFHKMGREKVFLVNAFLHLGYELLMCDTDMVWLKNPLPYLARFPEADVLISSDNMVLTVADDGLEIWQNVKAAYNIGIFHWRPTDPAKRLAKAWKDVLLRYETSWDQGTLNELIHKDMGKSVEGQKRLAYAFDGSLKLGILPASLFCNGHTYFVQAMPQQLGLEPYAVHTTFQYAGTEGKRHRLREAMLFYDQPQYYDSSGGFLSFKQNIPKSLLLDGAHTVESHFALVNYQLKQIRTAFAIALLLNRTLVMPPFWCRLDAVVVVPPGIIPNTMTPQPFVCPLDSVMEVNIMLSELPEKDYGPGIDFREHSFLQNPRLPKQVNESLLEVKLCDNRSIRCTLANKTTTRQVLRFPKNSTQEMFTQVFSKYKDVKVIQFASTDNAFGGFTDELMELKFRNRMKQYPAAWCCVEKQDPAHIYYDMYWDEKPNWKPEAPKCEADDHPPW